MLVFDGELRERLKRPFGPVYSGELLKVIAGKKIAAAGDYCIRKLIQAGMKPDIAVFDFVCMRKPVDDETREIIEKNYPNPVTVANAAGTITEEMDAAVGMVLKSGAGAVRVDGEEDLASLVLMALLPDGWVLAYGQPNEGMVLVEASQKIRDNAQALMARAGKKD
jgi:uncharacterized protein (UPF0218 family)